MYTNSICISSQVVHRREVHQREDLTEKDSVKKNNDVQAGDQSSSQGEGNQSAQGSSDANGGASNVANGQASSQNHEVYIYYILYYVHNVKCVVNRRPI